MGKEGFTFWMYIKLSFEIGYLFLFIGNFQLS